MDPLSNPYAPGAGAPPPALAGRDELLERFRISTGRLVLGRQAKSVMLVGLRGVGKTVLLDRMREGAEGAGLQCVRVEAPEGRSLPAILAPQLRVVFLRLERVAAAKALAGRALKALAGFVSGMKVKYGDLEIAVEQEPEPGLADSGDLELDLQDLLESAGKAAKEADSAIVLFVDELQYVPEPELAALVVALHRTAQRRLPVMLVGAGLPQLAGQMGRAKSYAERLFDFPEIGPLPSGPARRALAEPAADESVAWTSRALDEAVAATEGYPYFLQEWGKHAWDVAEGEAIRLEDVRGATSLAVAALDASFFRVRFDRLTPNEKVYLRAMAELGAGPHRSGEVAAALGRDVRALAPLRSKLIQKGMVYSPSHGDTAFTVPLFDAFMRRIMPGAGASGRRRDRP